MAGEEEGVRDGRFPGTVRGRRGREVSGPAKCPLDRSLKFFLGHAGPTSEVGRGVVPESAGVPSLAAGSLGEGTGLRRGLTLAARCCPGSSGQTLPSGPSPSSHPQASTPASARPGSAPSAPTPHAGPASPSGAGRAGRGEGPRAAD